MVSSVFALLFALCVSGVAIAAFVIPVMTFHQVGGKDIMSVLMLIGIGYLAIFASFVMASPVILLALRSASTAKGHVGRGRGLVSIVLCVTIPVLSLSLLSLFTIRRLGTLDLRQVIPQVTTDENGRMRITGGEALGDGMTEIIDEVNDLVEQGYSIGVDENGNMVAMGPDGRSVTVTDEDLERLAQTAPGVAGTSSSS